MNKIIGFATRGLVFNGDSLKEKALGGSESAMIYIARELAKLGNLVYVYCECDKPGLYDGVIYNDISSLGDTLHFQFDVFFISRFLQVLPNFDFSKLTIFWMHDVFHESFVEYAHQADKVFLMSEYQKSLWTDINENFDSMIYVTKNGYDHDLAQNTIKGNRKDNYIYASRPERGLKYLLTDIWPNIIQRNPNAKLHLCGYDIQPEQMHHMTHLKELYDEIEQLVNNTPNLVKHGQLTKKEYYALLGRCEAMLYPTDFPEISCINAIESQAMGCPVISTDDFALKETVKTKTLVKSKFGTKEYVEEFISLVNDLPKDIPSISDYSWHHIANEWNQMLDKMFHDRFENNKEKVFKQLIHFSDHLTAANVDPNYDQSKLLEIIHTNKFQEQVYDNPYSIKLPDVKQKIVDIINEYTKKKSNVTVLDIGCANGVILCNLDDKNIKSFIAFDQDKKYLTVLADSFKHKSKLVAINDNIDNLDQYTFQADVIILTETLEHIVNYDVLLNNIQRFANKDALVIFSTPIGPWSSMSDGPEEHLNHFEFLDVLSLFDAYVKENQFFIQSVRSGLTKKNELVSNLVYGYINKTPHTFTKLSSQHLLKKAIKTRPYESISVCMIVKNEEENIVKCLKSVKEIADEIIVVDTGSTDRTKELVSWFTDKHYDYQWDNNFSNARNFSVSKAAGDWIFYLDADEELVNAHNICNYVKSPYFKSFTITQKQILTNYNSDNVDQHPIRLFKKDSGLKFYGRIHEMPKLDPLIDDIPFSMLIEHSILFHYGYLHNYKVTGEKIQRNHDLLMLDIKDYPNKVSNYMYYIRDMRAFYELNPNNAFKQLAYDTWKHFPTNLESIAHKEYWLVSFFVIQSFRKETPNEFIENSVNGNKFLFATEFEYEQFLSINN